MLARHRLRVWEIDKEQHQYTDDSRGMTNATRGSLRGFSDCSSMLLHRELCRPVPVAQPVFPMRPLHDDWLFTSLHPDKEIDLSRMRVHDEAIHRDRLRDRPFEAGAT